MDQSYDKLFKILLIGNSGVGKSSILLKFATSSFSESYIQTIGVDFKTKTIEHEGKNYKLQVWDTAGQERFKSIMNAYYRGANAVIIVYDVTDKESFEGLNKHYDEASQNSSEKCVKIVVGNKTDIEDFRQVKYEDAKEWADSKNLLFLEASAKVGGNIEEIFLTVVREILNIKD